MTAHPARQDEDHLQTRVLRPLLITFGIFLAMAGFIGLVASVFLWNTKNGALVIAALGAAGILFVISLVAGRDRLDPPQRVVAVLAGILPLLVGGLYAADVLGGIDDAERNINVQPLILIPDDAPVIAAENSNEFCLLEEDGSCTPTESWTVEYQGPDRFAFIFENLEAGIPHNVEITVLEDGDRGEVIHQQTPFNGVDRQGDTFEPGLEPGEYYFLCSVHPVMNGILEVVEGDVDA
jgi:hypothetical protein